LYLHSPILSGITIVAKYAGRFGCQIELIFISESGWKISVRGVHDLVDVTYRYTRSPKLTVCGGQSVHLLVSGIGHKKVGRRE
jgi:hypothetical protein